MNSGLINNQPSTLVKRSTNYRLLINGEEIFIYTCDVANYALLTAEGKLKVEVEVLFPYQEITIRPLHNNISFQRNNSRISFELNAPQKISIEIDDDIRNPLFLLINPPETNKPDPNDENILYFKGGLVHHIGEITLKDNEMVYIEEGAVVHGNITAYGAKNIQIKGRGILDGSLWRKELGADKGLKAVMIKPVQSTDMTIEGITIVDGSTWHIVPIACQHVSISNVNIITFTGTGDGIDIVGSEDVVVENCFIRATDDCVAIKAVAYQHPAGLKDVRNVKVTNSVFWNAEMGNALEIGYETSCQEISHVTFSNCDVIHCEFEGHQSGGTFTIHNGDRAKIHHIVYEDIRVEDAQEKLVDFKILDSKYSRDKERGYISDIYFKDYPCTRWQFPSVHHSRI